MEWRPATRRLIDWFYVALLFLAVAALVFAIGSGFAVWLMVALHTGAPI